MKKLFIATMLVITATFSLLANEVINLSTGEWAPYTSQEDLKGQVAQTIVTEALKLENIDVVYKYYPWKRAYKIALDVDVDGTIPWFKTPERETEFYYSKQTIIRTKTVFFHLKNLDFDWKNYDDLKKYNIGGTLGFKAAKLLKDKGLKVELVATEEQNFRKLLTGKIDLTTASFLVGYNIINKTFDAGKAIVFTNHPKQVYPETGAYLLVSKKHPRGQELIDKFDRGLKKLILSGRYVKIIKESIRK